MNSAILVTKIIKLKILILFYFQKKYAAIPLHVFSSNYKSKNYTT